MRPNRHSDFSMRIRPSLQSRQSLPLAARSVGQGRLTPGETKAGEPRDLVAIFWGAAGHAGFTREGVPLRVGAGEALVYRSETGHQIVAGAGGFEYRWLTLDGPLAEATVEAYGLLAPPFPREAGPPPIALFDRLWREAPGVSLESERRAALTAHEILMTLACHRAGDDEAGGGDPLVNICREILSLEYADPTLTVSAIADRLGTDRTVLGRKFRVALGVTPKRRLTALRLRHGLALLSETDMAVSEIAFRSGFSDAHYFSRVIRSETGMSPSEFRRAH